MDQTRSQTIICMSLTHFGQVIIGPAGSGKSTYCQVVKSMCETLKRNIITVNLDPAAEFLPYTPDIDIRDLISLSDVMEEFRLGPNGGLIFCFEFLLEEFRWLEEEIDKVVAPGDYVLFDCPGQLELYMHLDIFKTILDSLAQMGFSLCTVCLVDSTFCNDMMKFYSGVLMALSTMLNLPFPALTVLSKADLMKNKERLQSFLEIDPGAYVPIEEVGVREGADRVEKMAEKLNYLNKGEQYFHEKYGQLYLAIKDLVQIRTSKDI